MWTKLAVALYYVASLPRFLAQPPGSSPCADASDPTCPDGNPPDRSTMPPSCSSGTPRCADGSEPSGPGGGGPGAGPGGPGGPGGGGLPSAIGCSTEDGAACSDTGSSSYYDSAGLNYASSTGKFSGTLKGNQCPPHPYFQPSGVMNAVCSAVTFPAAGYETGPKMAPLRGAVGYTLSLDNIYGPFEAGFGAPMPEACDKAGVASCPGGLDVPLCEAKLRKECVEAGSTVRKNMLLDDCGGHAQPYHYHVPMRCLYPHRDNSSHSPLIGIGLDGHGIYGVWEGRGVFPSLDACNGHVGLVPAYSSFGVASTSVYHYHVSPYGPFTIGCFGPVSSLEECSQLYPTCGDGDTVSFAGTDAHGVIVQVRDYDLDCPCLQHETAYVTASISELDGYYQDLLDFSPVETWTPAVSPTSSPSISPTSSSASSPTSSPSMVPENAPSPTTAQPLGEEASVAYFYSRLTFMYSLALGLHVVF